MAASFTGFSLEFTGDRGNDRGLAGATNVVVSSVEFSRFSYRRFGCNLCVWLLSSTNKTLEKTK
jgi:hypothetical protein